MIYHNVTNPPDNGINRAINVGSMITQLFLSKTGVFVPSCEIITAICINSNQ